MRDLLIAVPSRGRPASIARLMAAMAETCRGDTHLVVGLDEDDPARGDYPEGPEYEVRDNLRQVVGWVNELAVPRAGQYRNIGHIGDDNVPRTVGWDVEMCKALEATPFAFANDLYPRPPGSLACHVFMRSAIVRALGYFGAPCVRHMYVDVIWMAWGQATGITYRDDVVIEHMHYTAGKAPADESYMASTYLIPADLAAYQQYASDGRLLADVNKIEELLARPASDQFGTAEEVAAFNGALNVPPSAPEGWKPGDSLW